MEIVRRMVVEIKSLLLKTSKLKEIVFLPGVQKLNNMESNKFKSDECGIPNKKLCLEGENEVKEGTDAKIRKRNVAMLLAYYGKEYYGMQINKGFRTIEGVLFDAMLKAKLIPRDAVNDFHIVHFQRAARTDKGVSAAQQVVSLKLDENFDIKSINAHLPEDVKVFSIKRVTKGFNSKGQCDARTYSYTLPSYALAPILHEEYPENYRISEEEIQKINAILQTFVGTHSFHNFTIRKHAKDPSVKRYIMSFKTEDPFINGEEFVTLKVKGQSFMLHQIRKMVGYTIALVKGLLSPDAQEKVWKSEKFKVPLAPSLGLLLEKIHYDRYDKKYGNDGVHESLSWDDVAEEIKSFRENVIMPNIIKTEITERSIFNWLQEIRVGSVGEDDSKNECIGEASLEEKGPKNESNGALLEEKEEEEVQRALNKS